MCTNMPFKIYAENRYMWALSLAIVSISISIAIGDGTETRSRWCIIFVAVLLSVPHFCVILFLSVSKLNVYHKFTTYLQHVFRTIPMSLSIPIPFRSKTVARGVYLCFTDCPPKVDFALSPRLWETLYCFVKSTYYRAKQNYQIYLYWVLCELGQSSVGQESLHILFHWNVAQLVANFYTTYRELGVYLVLLSNSLHA